MRNGQLKLAEKKYKLNEMKRTGKKNPKWSLTAEELHYIQNLGFNCTVWIYEINTRTFRNVKNLPSIFKQLHYARLDGKKKIARRLRKEEIALLREYEVKFKPLKYEIHLHSK